MDREHLLPLGEGELLDRMHDLDAGIADEDVDAAERIDCRRHAHVDKVFTGDIHRNADGLAAELANLVGRDVRHRLVEVGDSNLGAFAREDECLFSGMTTSRKFSGPLKRARSWSSPSVIGLRNVSILCSDCSPAASQLPWA